MTDLSKQYIDQSFTGAFNRFPKVKKDLKETVMPTFAKATATEVDMAGFKTLLDKLEAKLSE